MKRNYMNQLSFNNINKRKKLSQYRLDIGKHKIWKISIKSKKLR